MMSTIDQRHGQITDDTELGTAPASEQRQQLNKTLNMVPSSTMLRDTTNQPGSVDSRLKPDEKPQDKELKLTNDPLVIATQTKDSKNNENIQQDSVNSNDNNNNNNNSNDNNNDSSTQMVDQHSQNPINGPSKSKSMTTIATTTTASSQPSSSSASSSSPSTSSLSIHGDDDDDDEVVDDDEDDDENDYAIDGLDEDDDNELDYSDNNPLARVHGLVLDARFEPGASGATYRMKINDIEKTVIVHRDENGFGLRIKGEAPVIVEHVHENSASWRAGVRAGDRISKVNGLPVSQLDHKDVVLMFKSSSRFIGLTLQTSLDNKENMHNVKSRQDATECDKQDDDNNTITPLQRPNPSAKRPFSSSFRRNSSLSGLGLARNSSAGLAGSTADGASSSPRSSQRRAKRLPPATATNLNSQVQSSQLTQPGATQLPQSKPESFESQGRPQLVPGCQLSEPYKPASLQNIERRRQSVRTLSNYSLIQASQPSTSNAGQPTPFNKQSAAGNAICPICKTTLSDSSTRYNGILKTQTQKQQQLFDDAPTCPNCKSPYPIVPKHNRTILEPTGSLRNPPRPSTLQQPSTVGKPNRVRPGNNGDNEDQQNPLASTRDGAANRLHELCQSASANSVPQQVAADQKLQVQQPQPMVVNKRLEIIREFINTEKTHTDRLSWLDQLFYQPLKTGGLMSVEQLRAVFSCHRTLYKIHRTIYKILLSANYGFYMEPLIGSALLEIFEGPLKRRLERAACTFCSAQATNGDLLNKLTRIDTKTGEFLAQVRSQQTVGRLGIKDLLASCFQRLTKYPLLLENLLKATPDKPPPNSSANPFLAANSGARHLLMSNHSAHPTRISSRLNLNLDSAAIDKQQQQLDADQSAGARDGGLESEQRHLAAQGDNSEQAADSSSNQQARRMLAICLAEEREFIERALVQSREILFKVNESIQIAESRTKLREIWKRTDKYPGVPLIDITNQHLIHDGMLTLRLSKRSFDVYMLLLNGYIIILTREGQDKYRLKFFTPESGSKFNVVANHQLISQHSAVVYSPVFVIDEHLTTRDAATDENCFYLLCKRKDDSRIYEFASRSAQERIRWRDKIQSAIDRQMNCRQADRRQSSSTGESTLTKSSSELSTTRQFDFDHDTPKIPEDPGAEFLRDHQQQILSGASRQANSDAAGGKSNGKIGDDSNTNEPETLKKHLATNAAAPDGTQLVGTISYVEDDGIIDPVMVVSSKPLVDQAVKMSLVSSH